MCVDCEEKCSEKDKASHRRVLGQSTAAFLLRVEKLEDPHESHLQLHFFSLFLEQSSQWDAWFCRACRQQLPGGAGLSPSGSAFRQRCMAAGMGRSMLMNLEDVLLNHEESLLERWRGLWWDQAVAQHQLPLRWGAEHECPQWFLTCLSPCHWDRLIHAQAITTLQTCSAPTASVDAFFRGSCCPARGVQLEVCSAAAYIQLSSSNKWGKLP